METRQIALIGLSYRTTPIVIREQLSCSVASVIGGMLGYFIGVYLWDTIGDWAFANMAWARLSTSTSKS